ncbi:TPA: FAD-dependent thymidylate synthase [Candidatus Dependentiae bacterium]|nr:FAD-dependent thymidylate synthase [Candidatus Dependentiae bacterium]
MREPGMENKPVTKKLMLSDGIGFVELIESFGSDLTIVNAARVSFHKESAFEFIEGTDQAGIKELSPQLSERDTQLVDYLAKHRHIAPFFHPQLRFRIKMPIFIAREWYRHAVGFCRNEVSRRYVTTEPECFVPTLLRQRDVSVKQGSSTQLVEGSAEISAEIRLFMERAVLFYNQLLEQGVCPEQARVVLPQSMYTEFIETASLAGYARLAGLRLASNAQREIGNYAELVSQLIEPRFPVAWKALMVYKTA